MHFLYILNYMAAKLNSQDKKRKRNEVQGLDTINDKPDKRLKVVNLIEGSRQSAFAKPPAAPEKKSTRLAKI